MTTRPTEAYPLTWPAGWKRTAPAQRKRAKFSTKETVKSPYNDSHYLQSRDLTVFSAMRRLSDELGRLGGRNLIVSTNVEVKRDGSPMSNRRNPDDPGVAVYFQLDGKDRVLACDRWDRVFDNIAAIAAHISAIRAVDRYDVGTLEQAFAGYAALPAPGTASKLPWRNLILVRENATLDEVKAAYRDLVKIHHPDRGGNVSTFNQITQAMRDAETEIGGK